MMEIRPMSRDDIFIVAGMERKYFSCPWSAESFLSALSHMDQIFLVVEDEGRIVGYCGMLCVVDEGQILNVAVDEEYRHMGVATALIRQMMDLGTDIGLLIYSLEVRKSNTPARNLYQKLGFREIGTRRDYYSKPTEDAVLMELIADDCFAGFFDDDDDED